MSQVIQRTAGNIKSDKELTEKKMSMCIVSAQNQTEQGVQNKRVKFSSSVPPSIHAVVDLNIRQSPLS